MRLCSDPHIALGMRQPHTRLTNAHTDDCEHTPYSQHAEWFSINTVKAISPFSFLMKKAIMNPYSPVANSSAGAARPPRTCAPSRTSHATQSDHSRLAATPRMRLKATESLPPTQEEASYRLGRHHVCAGAPALGMHPPAERRTDTVEPSPACPRTGSPPGCMRT